MKIRITLDLDDEVSDPGDDSGMTEEAYLEISAFVGGYGDIVSIEKVAEP